MTSVYSGGLVYEYTMEANGYGIVQVVNNSTVTELADYATLKKQLAANPVPTGSGGYSTTTSASTCPPQSSTWNVTSNALPAIPAVAAGYMKTGAGKGVGLSGTGSQWASGSGVASSGTATAGSGTVTATGAAASSSQRSVAGHGASFEHGPAFVLGSLVLCLMATGSFFL